MKPTTTPILHRIMVVAVDVDVMQPITWQPGTPLRQPLSNLTTTPIAVRNPPLPPIPEAISTYYAANITKNLDLWDSISNSPFIEHLHQAV